MGWINALARGYSVTLLGVMPPPSLAPAGSTEGHSLGDIHTLSSYALLALIGLHVIAALYHRLILKDEIIARIPPWKLQALSSFSQTAGRFIH